MHGLEDIASRLLAQARLHVRGRADGQGDGKTPEGTYFINRKNNYSAFHLSLGISYPNSSDRQNARSIGRSPGGDIFLHGNPNGYGEMKGDWTRGCIAVTNDEIEEIWGLIPIRTPITILS